MEDVDNKFHWLGNLEEKVISGDQSFWEFRVNLTNSSGHREGVFYESLWTFCFKFIETIFFTLEMSCVILKWIYIKDRIEKYTTKSKTICSEWNTLFPFKSNNVFWVNLKYFYFLIFFHISETKMPLNLFCFAGAQDHILHLSIGFNCSSPCFFKKK